MQRKRAIALLGIGAVIRILGRGNPPVVAPKPSRGNPPVVAPTINQPAIGTRISIGYRKLQVTSWFNLDLNPPTESLVYGATHPN
jgi:hypothetical protein